MRPSPGFKKRASPVDAPPGQHLEEFGMASSKDPTGSIPFAGTLIGAFIATVSVVVFLLAQGYPHPRSQPSSGAQSRPVLHEPVPVPSGYGFQPVPSRTTRDDHAYESTRPMSIEEAQRAQAEVMAYYERELPRDWIVVDQDSATIVLKDPDSTLGIVVMATMSGAERGPIVSLGIRALSCSTDYICH